MLPGVCQEQDIYGDKNVGEPVWELGHVWIIYFPTTTTKISFKDFNTENDKVWHLL